MIQRAAACLGVAFVFLAQPILNVVHVQEFARYHSPTPLKPLVEALLLDLLIVGLLFFVLVSIVRLFPFWKWIRFALACWLPLFLVRRILLIEGHPVPSWVFTIALVAWIAVALWLWRKRPALFEQVTAAGAAAFACLGFSTLLVATQLVRIGMWKPQEPVTIHRAELTQHSADHPRVVWVVLDELSYRQAFEHRAADLQLPALDALRAQSDIYTNAQPIGDKTERVLLGLLLGRQIEDLHYNWSNQLYVQFPEEPAWVRFPASDSLFTQAKQAGWNTGVAGWYNPYCSLFANSLDRCFWSNDGFDKPLWNLEPDTSAWRGAMLGLGMLVHYRPARNQILNEFAWPAAQLNSYRQILGNSLSMAGDDRMDYLLLHFPVPHFPGIYNRHTGTFTSGTSSYEDNMALADRTLAQVMDVLQKSPRWKDTTVIVCGDHSWRASWWQPYHAWTAEDERLSGGGSFDPRPVLLVHHAGQTAPVTRDEDVSLMEIHRIIAGTIRNGSDSSGQLTDKH